MDLITKIFGDDTKYKKGTVNLGSSLAKVIAQDSANKLDSNDQLVNGTEVTNFFPDEIKQALHKSKWKRLRKRLGKRLSLDGKVSVQIDLLNGMPYVSMGTLFNYTEYAGNLVEVVLMATGIYKVDGIEYQEYERFYIEDGVVKKMNGYYIDKEWVLSADTEVSVFPSYITKIPVQIFWNNEDGVSDVENTNMRSALEELNEFSNRMERLQTLSELGLIFNRNMTGKSGKEMVKSFKETGTAEVNGMDSQLGSGIDAKGALGYTLELAQLTDWLEDKIMKYTFTTRDTIASGSNKHNAEVGMFNQFAIEYLLDKKEIREEDYKDFYKLLAMFYPALGLEIDTVELQISDVLALLLKSMEPQENNAAAKAATETTPEEE